MTVAERNRKISAQIEATTKRGLKSKAAAKKILISEGILTKGGNLKAEFGGKGWRKKAMADSVAPQKRA